MFGSGGETFTSQDFPPFLLSYALALVTVCTMAMITLILLLLSSQPPLTSSFLTPAARRSPHRLSATTQEHEHDVIVIGSGIGGLCAASLCARHSLRTICVEAHDTAGGVAHSFERRSGNSGDGRPFVFDSGPSLLSGMSGRGSTNPLRQLMEAVGVADEVDWATYDGWMVSCDWSHVVIVAF